MYVQRKCYPYSDDWSIHYQVELLSLSLYRPELKVSDKVLGKKFNDVWYSGTILDVYPPSPSEGIEVSFLMGS